jgi:hypothetical protein
LETNQRILFWDPAVWQAKISHQKPEVEIDSPEQLNKERRYQVLPLSQLVHELADDADYVF